MKTREELLAEYKRLIKVEPFSAQEKSAVVNAMQWVIWGNGERPSDWVAAGNRAPLVRPE